tara:strand:- start:3419 stop:3859 length:441 start_codon:yes stop_codon:yes gene_type:complete
MVKILIKKLSKKAVIPKYESAGASGLDVSALIENPILIKPNEKAIIPTGLACSVPKNYEIQIRPRSGLAARNNLTVLNSPGTIDSDYRGEIKIILVNLGNENFAVKNGMRIAQMVISPVKVVKIVEVESLEDTDRGKGGFGSTGIK